MKNRKNMNFRNLEEKCNYFRNITDYRITPNGYTLLMLDGHCFSKMIKNTFKKPFDTDFITMMNETAKYLVEHLQGAKIAYTQSDEISILITDFDTPKTDLLFGGRLCKINSIAASMATSEFNRLFTKYQLEQTKTSEDDCFENVINKLLYKVKTVQFDCKCWMVPSENDMFAHFLWRNLDCVKNSKQQAAQTYIPHKQLVGKTADEGIALLKEKNGIDWNDYSDGMKYGRLIFKKEIELEWNGIPYKRNKFVVENGFPLNEEGNKEKFINLIKYKDKL